MLYGERIKMKNIPTAKEPEKLKAAYKEAYGDSAYDYKNNNYDALELRLLNDAYYEQFGDYVGTMCISLSLAELNSAIRGCLENNTPYDDGVPEGALI